MNQKIKEIVYFQTDIKDDLPGGKGLSLAIYIWNKFPARLHNEVYIKGILDYYDDFRLPCIVFTGKRSIITSKVKSYPFMLELTYYVESKENEYSLQLVSQSKFYTNRKAKYMLTENINKMLHDDPIFFNIKWFHLDEIRKSDRTENPFFHF